MVFRHLFVELSAETGIDGASFYIISDFKAQHSDPAFPLH
jgi:hypothetical protein